MSIDKSQLFLMVVAKLEESLRVLKNSAVEAKEASTNEESKAENKYDTRGLEASYLAQGQAVRAKKLEESLFHLKKVQLKNYSPDLPIGVSALVELLSESGDRKWFFLIPANGVTVQWDGKSIQTTSLDSPMGSTLFELHTGDSLELNNKEYEVLQCL